MEIPFEFSTTFQDLLLPLPVLSFQFGLPIPAAPRPLAPRSESHVTYSASVRKGHWSSSALMLDAPLEIWIWNTGCVTPADSRYPWSPPSSCSSWMEQEDKQGVCEAQDSQDKGMGSDSENCEDREGDPDERGMGSNPQDEAPRGHSEERELMPNICTEGLLSEEDGVAGREEEDDQSGVAEMAMFPGLSESDSISRSPQEEEEEESAGENRLEEEEEQPPPAVLPWRRHLSLGSRHRGDKSAHRRFRRLHHPMSMDLGELDSLMASIMDAPTICPDCGESFSPGAAFLQHQRIHRLAEAAAAASLEPFGFAGECEAVVGMMGVGGGFGAGPALARPPREKPFRCGDFHRFVFIPCKKQSVGDFGSRQEDYSDGGGKQLQVQLPTCKKCIPESHNQVFTSTQFSKI
ncbi:hypothetical protein JEQ12_000731 [Ovis aries]|uniref:C2H2-type domain-containing protein n=1 Tax=Ovis aries TaxID=9940 RepID=A0A836AG17_SHEEP|nr:hypothetical protein JEQ12_000731 [Ovis aries]